MKKIVISLAGVLAATAFAPEAAAVPAFARQVGMGCTACHAQHFPVLNSFGRAFKAGGYTMMGAQGKVEGDHLSIPDTLNASVVMKIRSQKKNGPTTAGASTSRAQDAYDKYGELQFFDEFALLMGGRVAENIGFLLEGQMIDPAGPFAAGFKMPFVFDMGAAKVSVTPFETDALGAQYGYEQSSGGVMRSNRWSEHRKETSAIQYNTGRDPAKTEAATGIAFVAQNDMGYVNITKFAATQGGGSVLGSRYIRIAATPTVQNWAMVVGLGNMSGQSFNGTTAVETKQTFIDFQAQGEVAGKELGVYVQRAAAPKGSTGSLENIYHGEISTCAACTDRTALTVGADYSVLPHVLSVGVAYRSAKNGKGVNDGDNALTVQGVYDLQQNVALHLVLSKYSGSAYTGATKDTSVRTLMLEAAW